MTLRRSNSIGVVGLGISTEHNLPNFFDEMLRGILQGGNRFDRDITVIRPSQWDWEHSAPLFYAEDYAGLIILGTSFRTTVMQGIDISRLPTVTIGGALDMPHMSSVDVDNYGSACAAVQHLIDLGHRRIGYISGEAVAGWGLERHRAYIATMTAAGLDVDESLIARVDVAGVDEGYDAACRLLLGDRPTAIAAVNDDTAHGALSRLQDIGVSVPDEISLIGFDDNLTSASSKPPLSTIRQPKQAIGARAVELLVTHILNDEAPIRHVTIPGVLVVRASTAAVNQA